MPFCSAASQSQLKIATADEKMQEEASFFTLRYKQKRSNTLKSKLKKLEMDKKGQAGEKVE